MYNICDIMPTGIRESENIMKKALVFLILTIALLSCLTSCSICSHYYNDWETTKYPTCTTEGEQEHYCFACGRGYETRAIMPLGHNWQEATCTEPKTCANCKSTDGVALGHSFGNWQMVTEPTCVDEGKMVRTCSNCDFVEESFINPTGIHTLVTDNAISATCTDTGLTEGKHCSTCNGVLIAQSVIPMLAHSYDDQYDAICNECGYDRYAACTHKEKEIISGYDATCTSAGLTDGEKCKECGEILTSQIVIDIKNHTEVIDKTVAATCTSTGLTEGSHCAVCGTVIVAQTVIDKLKHNFGEWVVAKEATETEEGLKERTCSCGEKEIEVIPVKIPETLGYIYFGEYPQTIKADDVTITDTTDSRGYYLGSDGFYYAKVTATPQYNVSWVSEYTFSNGASVIDGAVYYFKVEPIRWRILSEENGEVLILCDSIIEKAKFQSNFYYSRDGFYYTDANGAPENTYANNYEYSEVRAWLNSAFLENAFSLSEQEKILVTLVDNSAASTRYPDNLYVCNDTNDKIFLLSAAEATSSDYGFSTDAYDETKFMPLSDYAIAVGLHMNVSSDFYGNGYWWLRSPYYKESDATRYVLPDGNSYFYTCVSEYLGVVPALRITL